MPTSAGWYPGARQSCTRLVGPSPKMSREHAVQAVLTWIWTQDSLELPQLQASLWASRAEGRAKAEADEAGQARHTSFA